MTAPLPPVTGKLEAVPCDGCGGTELRVLLRCPLDSQAFAIQRCLRCGLVFLSPRPRQEFLSEYYPDDYYARAAPATATATATWRGRLRNALLQGGLGYTEIPPGQSLPLPAAIARIAARRVSVPPFVPNGRLLDIGCGTGARLLSCRALGWQVCGTEFDETAARPGRQLGLDVFTGDLGQAPWPAESFHAITLYHVLEHVPSPTALLAQLHGLLAADGRLVIVSPSFDAWERRLFGEHWDLLDVPVHFYHFTRATLTALLERSGFVCERAFSSSSSSAAHSALRLLPPRWSRSQAAFRAARALSAPFGLLADACDAGAAITVVARKAPVAERGSGARPPGANPPGGATAWPARP